MSRLATKHRLISLKPRIATLGQTQARDYDRFRGSSTQRGYNYAWQQARSRFLADKPLCVDCRAEGRYGVATEVDHIIPHRGNQKLFWDSERNWQGLCKTHHSAKTARGQ
jgi:5-methylcytosine-specific restriction protein A